MNKPREGTPPRANTSVMGRAPSGVGMEQVQIPVLV